MPVNFRGFNVGNYKVDLIVDGQIIVEVKAVDSIIGAHKAQVINYLAASGLSTGLIINFGKTKVEIARLIKPQIFKNYFIFIFRINLLNLKKYLTY